jgi:hypothetical protein
MTLLYNIIIIPTVYCWTKTSRHFARSSATRVHLQFPYLALSICNVATQMCPDVLYLEIDKSNFAYPVKRGISRLI